MTPEELRHAVLQIKMDEEMQTRILCRSLRGRRKPVRTGSWKRIAVIAAAAVTVLSVTVFAAVRNQVEITWLASSSYDTVSEAQAALEDQGGTLALPERFSNGYAFAGAVLERHAIAEEASGGAPMENDQIIEREAGLVYSVPDGAWQDGLRCTYEQAGERVTLYVSGAGLPEEEAGQWTEAGGHRFCYTEDAVSAASAAANEDGSAAETDQKHSARSLLWQDGGKQYSLTQLDGSLTRTELIRMALELYS